ncbi:MAG: hypothetical protein JNG85_07245 [Spirochaetaceae bacterium]|nr:hypothetical protein [Spirochaetaceae bacterium]
MGEADAAGILTAMLGRKVAIVRGEAVLRSAVALAGAEVAVHHGEGETREPLVEAVLMRYSGAREGAALLAFPPREAARILAGADGAHRVHGAEGADGTTVDFDAARSGILLEIGNVVINAAIAALPQVFKKGLRFAIPEIFEGGFATALEHACGRRGDLALMVGERLTIEAQEGKPFEARGELVILFPPASLDSLRALVPGTVHGSHDGA